MDKEEFERFKVGCMRVQGLSDEDKLIEYIKYKIDELKRELSLTDYEAIKYSEGWFTEEEYAPIKQHREELREKIRQLEEKLV